MLSWNQARHHTMDFGFTRPPSHSPRRPPSSSAFYFESTPEDSSPCSPQNPSQMSFTSTPLQCERFNYCTTRATFSTEWSPGHSSVHYTSPANTNTPDHRDGRGRESDGILTNSKGKTMVTSTHLRRRAQNRASQRAFRERKEKHMKGLERQLEYLHQKHQDLLQSYHRKTDEVSKLNAQIDTLTTELESLRNGQSMNNMLVLSKFDGFASHDLGIDCYFDDSATGMESEFTLDSFGSSL